jgi:hypothetical protein
MPLTASPRPQAGSGNAVASVRQTVGGGARGMPPLSLSPLAERGPG